MCFQVSACSGNLSWQYVNSINWSVRVEAIPSILLSACSFHMRSKWVSTNVRSMTMWHTIFNFWSRYWLWLKYRALYHALEILRYFPYCKLFYLCMNSARSQWISGTRTGRKFSATRRASSHCIFSRYIRIARSGLFAYHPGSTPSAESIVMAKFSPQIALIIFKPLMRMPQCLAILYTMSFKKIKNKIKL